MTSPSPRIILPAEWAEQSFIQLTWPHAATDWAEMLEEVNDCFVQIAQAVVRYEKLLIVSPETATVKALLTGVDSTKITFVELPTNDTWARDHGGITVFEDENRVIYDFTFNGWGMKFAANHDNQITRQLFEKGVFEKEIRYKNQLDFVLEGGSIESDGEGTLLTTAQCLLSENRNNKSQAAVEQKLKALFGLKQVLWLHHGYLAGDDTDSHVDTLARLCSPTTIAYVQCTDEADEHYLALRKMEEELMAFRTLKGEPYELIPLPMADVVYDGEERLPATYANFLIINGAVLLPTYDSPKDEIAKQQLQKAFPDRAIILIDCRVLIKQHGSLHCVTMQYLP
jgi:agmatine deiminase